MAAVENPTSAGETTGNRPVVIAGIMLAIVAVWVVTQIAAEREMVDSCESKGSYVSKATHRILICHVLPPDDLPI